MSEAERLAQLEAEYRARVGGDISYIRERQDALPDLVRTVVREEMRECRSVREKYVTDQIERAVPTSPSKIAATLTLVSQGIGSVIGGAIGGAVAAYGAIQHLIGGK